jgi:hypothetical protein
MRLLGAAMVAVVLFAVYEEVAQSKVADRWPFA